MARNMVRLRTSIKSDPEDLPLNIGNSSDHGTTETLANQPSAAKQQAVAHLGLTGQEFRPCVDAGHQKNSTINGWYSNHQSLDWFKGKITGNHGFYHQI